MLLLSMPVNANDLTLTYLNSDKAAAFAPSLSPIGQPYFGLRLGIAEADRNAYIGGLDLTVPVSAGVRLFAIRGDVDYWIDGGSGKTRGGDAFSVLGILGPTSSYYGAGIGYASRYGWASGPSGEALKVVYGSKFLPIVGYELSGLLSTKGAMGAAMITLHF
jgi:hypothetical protein